VVERDSRAVVVWHGYSIPLPSTRPLAAAGGSASILVRPQHVRLCSDAPSDGQSLIGTVQDVTYRGLGWVYAIDCSGESVIALDSGARARRFALGDQVHLVWQVEDSVLLPPVNAAW